MSATTWEQGAQQVAAELAAVDLWDISLGWEGDSPIEALECDLGHAICHVDGATTTRFGAPLPPPREILRSLALSVLEFQAECESDADAILSDVVGTICSKQADYGHDNINRFGTTGIFVRISDKIARLKNLLDTRNVSTPQFETVEDTWTDILGYCIVGIMFVDGTFQLPLSGEFTSVPNIGADYDYVDCSESRDLLAPRPVSARPSGRIHGVVGVNASSPPSEIDAAVVVFDDRVLSIIHEWWAGAQHLAHSNAYDVAKRVADKAIRDHLDHHAHHNRDSIENIVDKRTASAVRLAVRSALSRISFEDAA